MERVLRGLGSIEGRGVERGAAAANGVTAAEISDGWVGSAGGAGVAAGAWGVSMGAAAGSIKSKPAGYLRAICGGGARRPRTLVVPSDAAGRRSKA